MGKKLRIVRKRHNFSEQVMATKLGRTTTQYRKYEAEIASMPAKLIEILIRDFQVDPRWLFGCEEMEFIEYTFE